jgi:penicillin-binding protein 1A
MTAYVPPPPPPRRRSYLMRFLGFAFASGVLLFVIGASAAGIVLWKVTKELPDYEVLARYEPPVMTRIHANDGSLIAEYARERRIFVPLNTIPKQLIHAFLSAEDKNFYEHNGIDLQGVARAVVTNLTTGSKQGASTITQQVAKNFLLTNERTYDRKLKEAILAIRIERAFNKDQILELYLNEIFLGLSSYGVAAAALNYFGKELHELSIAEVAYLAALPKAPNNYHPFRHRKEAVSRRNWVIEQMAVNKYITPDEATAAKAEALTVTPRPFGAHIFAAEFFAEDVRRELINLYGEEKLYGGGLSVRTTLDPVLQKYAKKALVDGLARFDRERGWRGPRTKIDLGADWGEALGKMDFWTDIDPWRLGVVVEVDDERAVVGLQPRKEADGSIAKERLTVEVPVTGAKWALGKKKLSAVLTAGDVIFVAPDEKDPKVYDLMQEPEVEGAIVVMDPHTGRVLALVGGFSYAEGQFDRATQARRQPGSSFKPFVYATALDNGYTPSTVILDAPIEIEQGGGQGLWRPENYSGKFYGPSTLRTGIEFSRNLMTVRLAQDVGMPMISEYSRRFGVYEELMPVLSMALGAGETTLLRLTSGYAILANGGRQVKPTLIDRIQDRHGKTIWSFDERKCEGCDGEAEPDLADARKQVIDPHTAYQITSMMEGVIQRGTGTALNKLGFPVAGKTGTTNDEKDAWFLCYTPDLVVGVFMGFDTPKPMGKGATGGQMSAPIARDFLAMAMEGKAAVPFRIPPGIKLVRINRRTGARASSGDPQSIVEAFKPNTDPPEPYAVESSGWDQPAASGDQGIGGIY